MSFSLKVDTMELLVRHEGVKNHPYRDTAGFLTIGVGRNLEAMGISEDEALTLLSNDYERCLIQAQKYSWFEKLDYRRKMVVLSMLFNLGHTRFREFRRMIGALEKGDWERAACEMLASAWASQVKKRAVELSNMMRLGDLKTPGD